MDDYLEVKCEWCGKVFRISPKKLDWYDEMGYDYPSKCYKCRQIKKRNMERNEIIWLMGGNGQNRKPWIYGMWSEWGGFR
jgi:hypothetical protein